MPELTTQLLLDLLLAFIVLLFVPFGIRRGVAREAMVSAGIFLGALLAQGWADDGAAWLGRAFAIEPATAGFAVALAALLGGTFLLGYGASAAVATVRPGVAGRLAGGLLAAFNGALFLSYLLRFIETYLNPGDTLDDGIVAGVLLRRPDDLLLAAAGVLLVCIVVGWIVRLARGERVASEPALVPARSRPVRVAEGADAGKFESVAAAPARPAPVLHETAPLPVEPVGEPWRRSGSVNGHGAAAPVDASWRDGTAVAGGSAAGGAWTSWGQSTDPGRRFAYGAANDPAGDRRLCPTCGAQAGPNDVYCPQCGKSM